MPWIIQDDAFRRDRQKKLDAAMAEVERYDRLMGLTSPQNVSDLYNFMLFHHLYASGGAREGAAKRGQEGSPCSKTNNGRSFF